MARYIDADALIKRIQDEHKFGSLMLSNMIADMSTADVVEVVRCKDCIHAEKDFEKHLCEWTQEYHCGEWFCADGERRTDDRE